MKILVRLPNWMGDLIMSAAFIEQLQKVYPGSEISVIIKKGLEPLLAYFPPLKDQYLFSKQDHPGLKGVYRFGRWIKAKEKYDLYFTLPDSFSTALMGFATGATKRVGYKNEFRSLFLTNAYTKNKKQHRVEQYLRLLSLYSGTTIQHSGIFFQNPGQQKNNIVININSEASSRRLPQDKAVNIIEDVRNKTSKPILLIGAPNEKEFVDAVYNSLNNRNGIKNLAGTTSLQQLASTLSTASVMLSTDSGPAHLANALGIPVVVLFGAGNEKETAPVNAANSTVIRLGQLACEPCRNNYCKLYGIPKCLTELKEEYITQQVLKYTN